MMLYEENSYKDFVRHIVLNCDNIYCRIGFSVLANSMEDKEQRDHT
jgi:hypothetical protein